MKVDYHGDTYPLAGDVAARCHRCNSWSALIYRHGQFECRQPDTYCLAMTHTTGGSER